MIRGPLTFRESDLKRAVKSARESGLQVKSVEITKAGTIIVHVGKPEETEIVNPWDVKP
jgi:hypothetical protein